MKKYISVILAALLMCTALASTVLAYPEGDGYLYDGGLFLDEGTKAAVKEACDALYEAKGIRLAICTVDSTEGESSADYAAGVFSDWEVGNGVLILLVRDTNSYYAVQNNDLVEYLPNGKILEILDAGLLSAFENKDYSAGVLATVRSFSSYLTDKVEDGFGSDSSEGMPKALSVILKIVLIVALVIVAGYVALIIVEKRQAKRRREYLEYKRRMAREGRSYIPAGQRPRSQRPDPYGNRRRAPQGQDPRRSSPQGGGGQARSPRDVKNAATVQINTADIRAAMKNRR